MSGNTESRERERGRGEGGRELYHELSIMGV
jgi:hypothetical protein